MALCIFSVCSIQGQHWGGGGGVSTTNTDVSRWGWVRGGCVCVWQPSGHLIACVARGWRHIWERFRRRRATGGVLPRGTHFIHIFHQQGPQPMHDSMLPAMWEGQRQRREDPQGYLEHGMSPPDDDFDYYGSDPPAWGQQYGGAQRWGGGHYAG